MDDKITTTYTGIYVFTVQDTGKVITVEVSVQADNDIELKEAIAKSGEIMPLFQLIKLTKK